jgi:AP-3 complex subunit beta
MYLVRYAEDLPDLALLSISTFQKGLSDPNQLIRASALRVLSSIRVPVIVPIMQIALKQAASDMSPYVRKTAAHALPKLYQLAPAEADNVMEVLERLLHDRTTMVLGSVIMAFEEICPDRLDLVHRHFRKLCNTLIDIDEWGQVAIIHLLTRYSRTQFLDPNTGSEPLVEGDMPFYDEERKEDEDEEDDESDDESDGDSEGKKKKKRAHVMDPDHRLFLRSLLPLLHSRNAGVVMAVVQAYHYLAPHSEVPQVARAMVRLVKSHRETQYIVLTAIASMASERKGMFEPYIKSLFVRASDPQFVRLLKLEILTTLANESNISPILREFQEYVKHSDREFVTQTVQCIGRCASRLKNVTESCLQGLMTLMSNKDEAIVAESVVVIKKLLQLNPEAHKEIIVMMSKMANKVTVPMAKASVLWIIGEYSSHVPKIAPDVLRQMAQTFPQEEAIVKLQVLNLAAKLYIVNTKQTKLLVSYVLNLAKYDMNYDLRDRARLIRAIILTKDTKLHKKAKKFFLSEKPAPNLRSTFSDRDRFQVGTMSHVLNKECAGWKPLPEFPEDMPDPSVREVVEEKPWEAEEKSKASFFSETSSSGSDSDSDSDTGSSGSGSDSDSSDSEDETSTDTDSDATEEAAGTGKTKVRRRKAESSSEEENSFDSTSSDVRRAGGAGPGKHGARAVGARPRKRGPWLLGSFCVIFFCFVASNFARPFHLMS